MIIIASGRMIRHKVYIVAVRDKMNRNLFYVNKCWYDSTLAQQLADDFNDKYLRCHIFRIAYVQELFIDDSFELARSEDT